MTIIQKYVVKEIIKQFCTVLIAVISIYVIVDFFEKSDNFMRAGVSFSRTLTFFLLNTPFVVSQIAPVGILLAVIIIFSLMSKNNEILALRGSGISLSSLLRPVIAVGMTTSLLLFFFADIVVPLSTAKANRIWVQEVKKKTLMTSKEKDIWIKGHRRITNIRYYNPSKNIAFGVSIVFFDKEFNLIRKIDAESGRYRNGKWIIQAVVEQVFIQKSKDPDISFLKEKTEDLGFVPDDLKRVIKKPEEMSYKELSDYIQKIEDDGYDPTIHRVDLYAKPAYAFVCVIMCIIGAGVAVRQRHQQGIFFSITYGTIIAFFYWVFYSFCLSLGYGEMLPPLVAAWTANIVFICLGFLILMTVE
jgi:lipopolysaccharide export system permease protein